MITWQCAASSCSTSGSQTSTRRNTYSTNSLSVEWQSFSCLGPKCSNLTCSVLFPDCTVRVAMCQAELLRYLGTVPGLRSSSLVGTCPYRPPSAGIMRGYSMCSSSTSVGNFKLLLSCRFTRYDNAWCDFLLLWPTALPSKYLNLSRAFDEISLCDELRVVFIGKFN